MEASLCYSVPDVRLTKNFIIFNCSTRTLGKPNSNIVISKSFSRTQEFYPSHPNCLLILNYHIGQSSRLNYIKNPRTYLGLTSLAPWVYLKGPLPAISVHHHNRRLYNFTIRLLKKRWIRTYCKIALRYWHRSSNVQNFKVELRRSKMKEKYGRKKERKEKKKERPTQDRQNDWENSARKEEWMNEWEWVKEKSRDSITGCPASCRYVAQDTSSALRASHSGDSALCAALPDHDNFWLSIVKYGILIIKSYYPVMKVSYQTASWVAGSTGCRWISTSQVGLQCTHCPTECLQSKQRSSCGGSVREIC